MRTNDTESNPRTCSISLDSQESLAYLIVVLLERSGNEVVAHEALCISVPKW